MRQPVGVALEWHSWHGSSLHPRAQLCTGGSRGTELCVFWLVWETSPHPHENLRARTGDGRLWHGWRGSQEREHRLPASWTWVSEDELDLGSREAVGREGQGRTEETAGWWPRLAVEQRHVWVGGQAPDASGPSFLLHPWNQRC